MSSELEAQVYCDDVKAYADDKGEYTLGKVLIGEDLRARPGAKKAWDDCLATWSKGAAPATDCEFIDDDKVAYEFNAVSPGAYQIIAVKVNKQIGYHGSLLANLALGDSLETVRRKLERLPSGFPKWILTEIDGAAPVLRSDYCLKIRNGQELGYTLSFDSADRLVEVSLGFEMGMGGPHDGEPCACM